MNEMKRKNWNHSKKKNLENLEKKESGADLQLWEIGRIKIQSSSILD